MNKGLTVHLIGTFIYIFCIMYIFQEQIPNKSERVGIIMGLFFINAICLTISDTNNFYREQIKRKK